MSAHDSPPATPADPPTVAEAIIQRIAGFKADLTRLSAPQIVRRHITFGSCYLLGDEQYFDLKNVVASEFKVHPSEVVVIGSAKQGFSIAPAKRYAPFGDKSDIDIAIISSSAFDLMWQAVFDFRAAGGFWGKLANFNDYLARGWIRPDLLPTSPRFRQCNEWWKFFGALSRSGQFGRIKISAALYRNWHFLETRQTELVTQCVP